MSLQGAGALRARIRAITGAGESLARDWADENVRRTRSRIRHRTGKTAASVRVGRTSNDGATVVGSPVVNMLAKGTRAHPEVPVNAEAMRFEIGGRTIFSKKVMHPATRGDPRIRDAARDALDDAGFAEEVYRRWNGAA